MAGKRRRLNHVESCQLGKLESGGVALKINFAMSTAEGKEGPIQSAEFGMSPQVARGLADALKAILNGPLPAETKPTQN